jgi:hypothetical protein
MAEPFDGLQELGELVDDLLPLQAGQALQLHVEDGLRLDLRQLELHHQAFTRFRRALRSANQLDHFVQVIERDLEAFEDVGARFGLAQLEFGPASHDLAPELDEVLEDLDERQYAGPAGHNREHDDPERRLQLRVLVEVVEDDLWHFAAPQLDHDPHALAVGLVPQIADPLDRLLARELGNLLEQPRLVHLVGDLGDDDGGLVPLLVLLDLDLGAHRDCAPALLVGVEDSLAADQVAARREIGSGNGLQDGPEQLLRVGLPPGGCAAVLDHRDHAVDHLAHVVRRDVGGHADRDAGGSVDEQVREGRRKDGRLFGGLVVVGNEVDGLLVEIRHHRFGKRLGPRFGVAHGRRRIAVDRSEVPLAVDQGIAHVEILRETNQRVVDRLIAVRVIVAHHLADDLGALAIRAIGREAHGAHAEEHAAVRGLQPVAHVGQRAPDDYAHRVIHVRALHLVFDVYG